MFLDVTFIFLRQRIIYLQPIENKHSLCLICSIVRKCVPHRFSDWVRSKKYMSLSFINTEQIGAIKIVANENYDSLSEKHYLSQNLFFHRL